MPRKKPSNRKDASVDPGRVGRGGGGVLGDRAGGELPGVERNLRRGEADHRVDAGYAIADVAEVGGCGERGRDHAVRQRVTTAATLVCKFS